MTRRARIRKRRRWEGRDTLQVVIARDLTGARFGLGISVRGTVSISRIQLHNGKIKMRIDRDMRGPKGDYEC
jgi:hypothetical protein